MLTIRLFRVGKKNQPAFKIVVTDKRKPTRAGRFVEEVGFYNPLTKARILKKDRIQYWLSVGAKPSATLYNMLVSEGIVEGKKTSVHKKSKKEEAPPPEAPKEEKVPEVKPPAEEKKPEPEKPAEENKKES